MRDFRDAKAMAQTLREALNVKSVSLTHSESLELGRVDKPNPDSNGCKNDEGCEALDEFVVTGRDPS